MQLANSQFGPGSVTARRSQVTRLKTVPPVNTVGPLVRWAFYAFVFSILFEVAPIGIPLEATDVTAGFLVASALLFQPIRCFRHPPSAVWCFVVYLWMGLVTLAFNHLLFDLEVVSHVFKLLQLIFLFWIAYNVMRDECVARGALLSLAASCAALSLLQMFGLTTTTDVSRFGRISAFGLDSNHLAGVLSLGVLALVGLVYGSMKSVVRPRLLIWPVFALIGVTLVQTGSRGALLALGGGLLVFTLRKGTVLTKLRNVLIVLLGLAFFSLIAYQTEMVKHRFQVTLEDGNMSEREQIYPLAWQMFLERPVIGWGFFVNSVELGNRLDLDRHERIDTHNLILYVLTATGVVGAIPFFIGVWLCLRAAWRARGGPHGVLPLAMTLSLLIADMSVSGLHWKQHWLVLAYALASGYHSVIESQRARSKPELRVLPAKVEAF